MVNYIYNSYLHGVVQFLFLPLLLDSLLLLFNQFLCLEVSRCTVLHGVVCVLWVGLQSQHEIPNCYFYIMLEISYL